MNKHEEYNQKYTECSDEVLEVLERYQEHLCSPILTYLLIQTATAIAFECAPNQLNAVMVLNDIINKCVKENVELDAEEEKGEK